MIDIPESIGTPTQARDSMRPPSHPQEPGGDFLSIIGFDGKLSMQTFSHCMAAQGTKNLLWRGWYNHGHEGQIRARNECAYQFLKTPCERHLIMDSDILADRKHVLSLRKHPEAKEHIICGAYAKKSNRVEWCYNSLKGGNPAPNKNMLMEVATAGTGFMQIPRSAYLKIQAKFPKRWYSCEYLFKPDGTPEKKFSYYFQDVFFDENCGLVRDMTEDWSFCWMARQAGVKIYLDLGTIEDKPIAHLGATLYPLEVELERLDLKGRLEDAEAKIKELQGAKAA